MILLCFYLRPSSSKNTSFRLSALRPSVTSFSQCSFHRIILKFSGVFTIDRHDVRAKHQGQMSKVTVTEVKANFAPDHTSSLKITDGYEMIQIARSSIEELLYCFSRSSVKFQGHRGQWIYDFDPDCFDPDCTSSLNSLIVTKWCT